jgi:hypothetical protein
MEVTSVVAEMEKGHVWVSPKMEAATDQEMIAIHHTEVDAIDARVAL